MHCADHVIYIIFSSWNTRVFLNRISKNLVFAVPGLYISYYSHYSNWAVLSYIGKLVKAPLIKSHKIQQFDVNCLDSAESEKAKVPVKTMKLYRYCRVAVSKVFYVEYICGFVWWGVCMQSRWRHSVTEPHTRWRICVTMATLWQQQDGGYMLFYICNSTVVDWTYLFFMCVTQKHQMVLTHDLTMETAVASDMYYKWISINAFSWTLHNIGSY